MSPISPFTGGNEFDVVNGIMGNPYTFGIGKWLDELTGFAQLPGFFQVKVLSFRMDRGKRLGIEDLSYDTAALPLLTLMVFKADTVGVGSNTATDGGFDFGSITIEATRRGSYSASPQRIGSPAFSILVANSRS